MTPEKITSGCWLLWYREDLPRTVADVYWEQPHGDIVAKLPHITEYLALLTVPWVGFWSEGAHVVVA